MKAKKIGILIYVCVLLLLINLGLWQLRRAVEKQNYMGHKETVLASTDIINLTGTTEDNIEQSKYKKVKVVGHYDEDHQFLIDNQISAGKVGYLVLTPFILADQSRAVLVNRGWLPINQHREDLPMLKMSVLPVEITGRINSFPSVGIKLAGSETPGEGWPSVLQIVDTKILAEKVGYKLFSFQVELDKESPEGFKREWQTNKIMSPDQHKAYALQWFALAIALTALFYWYSKKNRDE